MYPLHAPLATWPATKALKSDSCREPFELPITKVNRFWHPVPSGEQPLPPSPSVAGTRGATQGQLEIDSAWRVSLLLKRYCNWDNPQRAFSLTFLSAVGLRSKAASEGSAVLSRVSTMKSISASCTSGDSCLTND